MSYHTLRGKWGEDLAADFLEKAGYELLHRNWRFHRAEIDIICKMEDTIVFVEVRTRSRAAFGRPEDTIGTRKRRLIADAASHYLFQTGHTGEMRFDIIGILAVGNDSPEISHFRDAFYP